MTRTDNDHWDLATSVGPTATMVAAARAAASRRSDAVINDAFAGPLVRAVGVEFFIRIADGEFDDVACDAKQGPAIRRLVDVLAVRTRHFDRFLTEAAHSGISQIVILAAGLDARSYRLRLPLTATVYEVDQPLVIAFKSKVIAGMGIGSLADRRFVGVDLKGRMAATASARGFRQEQAHGLARGRAAELSAARGARSLGGQHHGTECEWQPVRRGCSPQPLSYRGRALSADDRLSARHLAGQRAEQRLDGLRSSRASQRTPGVSRGPRVAGNEDDDIGTVRGERNCGGRRRRCASRSVRSRRIHLRFSSLIRPEGR